MTTEEKAKLKLELADLSVEALEQYRKMFIRLNNLIWTVGSLEFAAGMLDVTDALIAEQNEQPETLDV